MLIMPSLLLATSVVSAIIVWALGTKRGIPFITACLILIGVIALISSKDGLAAFLLVGPFILPFIIGASALGVAAGVVFKTRWFPVGFLLLTPPLLFLTNTHSIEQNEQDVERQGMNFVSSERHLVKLLGHPIQASLVTLTKNRDGQIYRLEYSFPERESLYAIVDVSHDKSSPTFRLACITSIYMGHRDVAKDACAQGVLALPETL